MKKTDHKPGMVGDIESTSFKPGDDHNEFYSGHQYAPFSMQGIVNAHQSLPRVAWALDVAAEIKPLNVLDLGCRDGFAGLTMLYHGAVNKAVGVDLSIDGIKLANEATKHYKLDARFYQENVLDWLDEAISEGQLFEMVLLFEFIEHVEDPVQLLSKVNQVLAPGGQVLISTPDLEGYFGSRNDDTCHLWLYTHRDQAEIDGILAQEWTGIEYHPNNKSKPAVSLSDQVGKDRVIENEVWNHLIHLRYK